jgi:hypothetical protein
MRKIILLGDSIRLIGYGKPVAERLSGDFEVWQPTENCRYAKYTLRGLWEWKKELVGADIIHWNNGLWDICDIFGDGMFTPIDQYVAEMTRLARLLQQRARVVIFATTTPVRPDNPYNDNAMIKAANDALVPKLREMGIVINDLYSPLSQDLLRYIGNDKIHLSEDGISLCTERVETAIRTAAELLDTADAAECPMQGRATASDQSAPV